MIEIVNTELAQIINRLKIQNKTILNKELEDILQTNIRLDDSLLEKNLMSQNQASKVYEQFFGIKNYDIDRIAVDSEIVRLVTSEFVDKYNILPLIKQKNGKILIAISNPFDYRVIDKVKSINGDNYELVIASEKKIHKISTIIFSKASTNDAIEQFELEEELEALKAEEESEDVTNSPAVKLVESIIRESIALSASDIHIEPYEKHVKVKYRIDGTLHLSSTFDKDLYPAVSTRIKILAGVNIAEKRIPQDGRIKQKINNIEYDFRVSTLPTVYGERIVIRILDTQSFDFTRDKLGFYPEENKIIDRMINLPFGIVLLTGPTGCGKSTTLYSFVREISEKNINIITVEDPVEYTMEGVNQVQVNNKANLTFAAALRSILRQDPNVIMIGEIRDEETAEIAIRSAITGHLVFSTLHTNDAPGAVTRLVDMGVQPYLVADALSGVIAQRLVRRLCPHCKKPHTTTEKEMKILGLKKPAKIFSPCGCPACNNTGYRGRLGIHEVLVVDEQMKEIIEKQGTSEDIRKAATKAGMLTLKDTCLKQVLEGNTSIEEFTDTIFDID